MIIKTLVGRILSPLHIGTGEELEPFDYVVQASRFCRIDLQRALLRMAPAARSNFDQFLTRGDLAGARSLIAGLGLAEHDFQYTAAVSDHFRSQYGRKIGQAQNQLLVQPFVRDPTNHLPLVSGSSIKGALRTAILSAISRVHKEKGTLSPPRGYREEAEFEMRLLGCHGPQDDPFRALKISDAHLSVDSIRVVEVVNVAREKERGLQQTGVSMFCEVTNSLLSGQEIEFRCELRWDDALLPKMRLKVDFRLGDIGIRCNSFYYPKLRSEHEKFFAQTPCDSISKKLLNLMPKANECLIRIGRFQGVETVTLDGYRSPKIPRGRQGWGNTRQLAEGRYPMGWVLLSIL
jgi:CRISPR-associated protein Csm5